MQKKEAQPLTRPNYAEPPPEYSLDTMPGKMGGEIALLSTFSKFTFLGESTGPRYRDFVSGYVVINA